MSDVLKDWKLTVFHQQFSLPWNLVFYMAKNPPSPEVYNKLIRCCKYFWLKNPIITLDSLCRSYDEENWETYKINGFYGRQKLIIEIENLNDNLWIYYGLSVYDQNQLQASSIIPKIYRCDIDDLSLSHQNVSFNEFKKFTSSRSFEILYLYKTTVKTDDGTIVPIEKLIEVLPKLRRFDYDDVTGDDGLQAITSETAAKLVIIPHFHQIEYFSMERIPESFNNDAFFATPKVSYLNCFAIPRLFSQYSLLNKFLYKFRVQWI